MYAKYRLRLKPRLLIVTADTTDIDDNYR